jgi:hypothetical protein
MDHLTHASPHALDDVSTRAEEWLFFRSRSERDIALKALRSQGFSISTPNHGDLTVYHTLKSGDDENHAISTLLYPMILTSDATVFIRRHAAQGSARVLDTYWDVKPATLDEAIRIEHMRDNIRCKKGYQDVYDHLQNNAILIHSEAGDGTNPTLSAWFTDQAKARDFALKLSQAVPEMRPVGTLPEVFRRLDIGGKMLYGFLLPPYPSTLALKPFVPAHQYKNLPRGIGAADMLADIDLNQWLEEAYAHAAKPKLKRGRCE